MFRIPKCIVIDQIKLKITFFLILITYSFACFSQTNDKVVLGADQLNLFLNELSNKRVALVANHTSKIKVGNQFVHLLDTLLKSDVNIVKVFSPEHGFRGIADAGEKVSDGIDQKTGVPIISLHGDNKKPKNSQISDVDIIIFDIQDVGVRFYTYISTLHLVMESVAENNKKLIVLDRPNPNGHYIDGPVLENEFKSFVGMHKVPIVYGMTIGEFSLMINNEGWLNNKLNCDLSVIPMKNYYREKSYNLPIRPSPNLPNSKSIDLYPSLCFFEQTPVSVGRGTNMQFQVFGNPDWENLSFSFTPKSMEGAKYPKHENINCFGIDLRKHPNNNEININWLLFAYNNSNDKKSFFRSGFNRLAGNDKLKRQIIEGVDVKKIKKSWEKGIKEFMSIRSKYLIY